MTLLDACLKAHHESALRGNCSHHALVMSAVGSGDYFKSIAAALLTLGGTHAPLTQTYDLLAAPNALELVEQAIHDKRRVPGWGNTFYKGTPDPAWIECAVKLAEDAPVLTATIDSITKYLHICGKNIYPNPSCYTAAVALTLGIPRAAVGVILLQGRLRAWTEEYGRVAQEAPRTL